MSSASAVTDQEETQGDRQTLVILVDDDRNLCDLVERFLEPAELSKLAPFELVDVEVTHAVGRMNVDRHSRAVGR